MTTYRGYTIDPCFYYNDGKMDGAIFQQGAEEGSAFYRQTMTEVKREIDDKIYEKTEYRVYTRNTITKFLYIEDAIKFADKVFGEVRMYVDGKEQEMSFNF